MRLGLSPVLTRWVFSYPIWKRCCKWIKTKTHTCCISVEGRKRIKMKTITNNNAGAFFCSMRIEFSLRHSVQFYRFSVDSGKRTKTVVWTQIDRCVFDVNENSYFWKRISVDRAWTYVCFVYSNWPAVDAFFFSSERALCIPSVWWSSLLLKSEEYIRGSERTNNGRGG